MTCFGTLSSLAALACLAGATAARCESVPEVGGLVRMLQAPSDDGSQPLKDEDFVADLQNLNAQQPSRVDAVSLVENYRLLPAARIDIRFRPNTAIVSASSMPVVEAVGKALSDGALKRFNFVIVDHTDTAGGKEADLALSRERAGALRALLLGTYDIGADRIVAQGAGEEWLSRIDALKGTSAVRIEIVTVKPETNQ